MAATDATVTAKPGDIATGTTILACEFEGGVVLAADSRTSTGSYVANRVSDKITSLSKTIYTCRSGSAADTQAVSDYAARYLRDNELMKGRPAQVRTAAHLVANIIYENKDALMAGMIVAGWDAKEGGQVFSIPLGGTLVRQPLAVGGSGSTYILALCDREYTPSMSKAEAVAFARRMVSHAMARDGSSGGVIRTVVITAEGVERDFMAGDKLPFHIESGIATC